MPYFVYLLLKSSQARIKAQKAKANQSCSRVPFYSCTGDISVHKEGQKQMHLYFFLRNNFTALPQIFNIYSLKERSLPKAEEIFLPKLSHFGFWKANCSSSISATHLTNMYFVNSGLFGHIKVLIPIITCTLIKAKLPKQTYIWNLKLFETSLYQIMQNSSAILQREQITSSYHQTI